MLKSRARDISHKRQIGGVFNLLVNGHRGPNDADTYDANHDGACCEAEVNCVVVPMESFGQEGIELHSKSYKQPRRATNGIQAGVAGS